MLPGCLTRQYLEWLNTGTISLESCHEEGLKDGPRPESGLPNSYDATAKAPDLFGSQFHAHKLGQESLHGRAVLRIQWKTPEVC